MRLRMGRCDFFGASFEPLKSAEDVTRHCRLSPVRAPDVPDTGAESLHSTYMDPANTRAEKSVELW